MSYEFNPDPAFVRELVRLDATQARARLAESLRLVKAKKNANAKMAILRVERELLAAARLAIMRLQTEIIRPDEPADLAREAYKGKRS